MSTFLNVNYTYESLHSPNPWARYQDASQGGDVYLVCSDPWTIYDNKRYYMAAIAVKMCLK